VRNICRPNICRLPILNVLSDLAQKKVIISNCTLGGIFLFKRWGSVAALLVILAFHAFAEEIPAPVDAIKYPQVNIEGFKEYRFHAVDILPGSDPVQYKKDPAYSNIPAEALIYPGLRERFHLDIEGKLNDKLSVKYHLVQEPDLPEVFDIQIRYDRTVLQFGDFDQSFKSGSFIGVSKRFNGVQVYADYNDYDFKVVSSKEKSTVKAITLTGDGVRQEFALANTNILEGSLQIFLNGVLQKEGQDYTVNYFSGKIIFTKIPSSGTPITAQYEFTNPIEDFLPIAGRKNFLGAQFNYRNQEIVPSEPVYVRVTQVISTPTQAAVVNSQLGDWTNTPRVAVVGAAVSGNLSLEIRASKYVTAVQFKSIQNPKDFVRVGLNPAEQIWRVENWQVSGNAVSGTLSLWMDQIRMDFALELEKVNGAWIVKSFNPQPVMFLKNSKILFFPTRADQGQNINFQIENKDLWAEMRLVLGDTQGSVGKQLDGIWSVNILTPREYPTGMQTVYFSGIDGTGQVVKQAIPIPVYLVTQNQKVVNRLSLDHNSIRLGSEQVMLSGQKLKQNKDYWLDSEKGEITFKDLTLAADQKLQISYDYLSQQAREEKIQGGDYEGPYYLKFTPVSPKDIQVWVDDAALTPADYDLDPIKGRMIFNFKVFKSSQIRVKYMSVDQAVPASAQGQKKKTFEVGAGFLQESAKSSQASLTKTAVETNALKVSVNGVTVVQLVNKGILNDSTFAISFNGVPGVQNTNYIFQPSRGWIIPTGSLTVTSGTVVNVSYKYTDKNKGTYLYFYKSQKSSWLVGSSTLRIRDLYPQSVPMAHKTLKISAFREGSSVEMPMQETNEWTPGFITDINTIKSGNTIQDVDDRLNLNNNFENSMQLGDITFVTGNNTTNPQLLNIDAWMTASNISYIRILVDKVANDVPDFGEINHQVYDVHAQYNFNPDWSVYADMAQSKLSFQRPVSTFQNTFPISSNASLVFTLLDPSNANVEVVEDSLHIFLDNNPLIENSDYFVNYKQGKVTLVPRVLPKQTALMVVNFSYYSAALISGASAQNKIDNAYAVNVTGKISDVKLKSETQIIGEKFDPVGNTYYPAGSQIQRLTAEYVPPNSSGMPARCWKIKRVKRVWAIKQGKIYF
jgi:hypothetical protein